MKIVVHVPGALRAYVNDQAKIPLEADTVGDAIHQLTGIYPALGMRVGCDAEALRSVKVFLNDNDIRHLGGNGTVLRDGDEILLLQNMSGG